MRRLVTFILAIALLVGIPTPISESNFSRKLLPAQRPQAKIILMKVTAYDPNCPICTGRWCKYGKTSTGANAQEFNGVAADLELLPKGTRLYIPDIGDRVVDDTGGGMKRSARKGIYHIDLRVPSHGEAEEFGVQWKEVTVFE